MSDQDSIFYKRNPRGEIIINVNGAAAKNFFRWVFIASVIKPLVGLIELLYTSLNYISNRKPLVIISAGLGLGFGMGLVIFQRPMTTLASPLPIQRYASEVTIKTVAVGGTEFEVSGTAAETSPLASITHLETSAGVHQAGTSVLAVGWRHEAKPYLLSTTLNDPIQVIGSNNGRYSYRIVEIKEVENNVLPTLFTQNGRALVLYTPTNLLHTKFLVIVAK